MINVTSIATLIGDQLVPIGECSGVVLLCWVTVRAFQWLKVGV